MSALILSTIFFQSYISNKWDANLYFYIYTVYNTIHFHFSYYFMLSQSMREIVVEKLMEFLCPYTAFSMIFQIIRWRQPDDDCFCDTIITPGVRMKMTLSTTHNNLMMLKLIFWIRHLTRWRIVEFVNLLMELLRRWEVGNVAFDLDSTEGAWNYKKSWVESIT